MSDTEKVVRWIIAIMIIGAGLFGLSTHNNTDIEVSVVCFFLGFLISPLFINICDALNIVVSKRTKIILAIGTFIITSPFVSINEEKDFNYSFIISIILIIIFWLFVLYRNKTKNFDSTGMFNKKNSVQQDLIERQISDIFKDSSLLTTYAISKMTGDIKNSYFEAYNKSMPEIDYKSIIKVFCKDIMKADTESELNSIFNKNYYKNIIKKYFKGTEKYIKGYMYDHTSSSNMYKIPNIYNEYIDIFCDSMILFEKQKFIKTIDAFSEDFKRKFNYIHSNIEMSYKNMDKYYKNAFKYIIEILASSTCIAKMVFVENKINQIDKTGEFYKMIYNMSNEIKDVDLIVEKIRPIYNEFYQHELGYIQDQILYNIAITIIVNKIQRKDNSPEQNEILDIKEENVDSIFTFDPIMEKWISNISAKNRNLDIRKYIVYKIVKTINVSNLNLFFEALSETNKYEKLYNEKVQYNNKLDNKERYLIGDFDKEKEEQDLRYSYNNIFTGEQFEIYLENIFKKLGYKVNHCGKTGDQGADLVLKINDYKYVVQAKFYSSKLSNTPIQEIVGAIKYYNANQGVVVTNNSFTVGGIKLAKANNVILIDGEKLEQLSDLIFETNKEEDVLKRF